MKEGQEVRVKNLEVTPEAPLASNADINLGNANIFAAGNVHIGHVYQAASNPSPPINHTLVLQRLQKNLCARYQHYTHLEHLFDESKTPIADSFINLALIKGTEYKAKEQDLAGGGGDSDEREKLRDYIDERMASHEQLYAVKEPLALTELFEPKNDTQSPNKILILGRAGIGKSILCQYLATQWASGVVDFSVDAKDEEVKKISVADYLQQKFDAVFWLKLREVAAKTTDHDTFVDVLDRFCLEGLDKPEKAELNSYMKKHSDKILFILDGYDEITDRINQPEYLHVNRILADIATHQHILLTSRPIPIDALGDHPIHFNRRLENMGFLNENIEAYVHQFMRTAQKPEQTVPMLDFLKAHSGVWGIAHIPINLELLSWLWSKGKLAFEKGQIITLSKLYQTIVDHVQKAYTRKTSKRPVALNLEDCIGNKKEDRKISTVATVVNEFLECLAYNAMKTETLFIPALNVKTALEQTLTRHEHPNDEYYQEQLLKSATDKLGFLRAAGQDDESQLDQDHYFIHLSFQEFYAARYMTRILSKEPHSKEGQNVFQCILTEKYTPRYQLTLWMSAGLLYQQGKKSQHQQFSPLFRFWRAILSQPRDMIGFHHNVLILHCLDECEADNQLSLHKKLIAQQWKWFKFYAEKCGGSISNPYAEQFAQCSILLASASMVTRLLWASKNGNVILKRNAVRALRYLSTTNDDVIEVLLSVLQDEKEDGYLRSLAASALGHLNNPSEVVIQALLCALQDSKQCVSGAVASVLGKLNISIEIIIEKLLNALQGQYDNIICDVISELGQLNNPSEAAIEILLNALRDENENIRYAANCIILDHFNNLSEAVIKKMICALRDENTYVRFVIAQVLGKLNNPNEAAIESLLNALWDEDEAVKCVAASALGNLNNPSEAIIKGLQNAFESENKRVKIAAAEALNRLKHSSETIITELLNALQNGNWYARSDAASALSKLEDPSEALIKGLLNILRDEDKDVRDAVSTAFEEAFVKLNSPSEAIITELFSVLRDKELIVNEAPALALSKLKNPSAVVIKILINALRDENERVRKASAVALGNLNSSDEAVIEALINALWDKDWSVRDVVAEALGKLNNPSEVVIEVLISASWKTSSAAEALSTPKAIHATTLIFKQLIRDEQGSIEYFSCWFEKNYLLVMDSKKGNVIARQGRQNYSIPLSPNDLAHLEKQVTAVAKHKNYPSEFYNLSGGSSSHVEKAILQDCQPNTSVCFVSNAMWLVHLVRKKAGERTLLIVEGLVAGKHIAQCYEFALSQRNSNPSSGFFLPGGGVGDVLKTRNFLDLLEKHKKDYQYKSWDIDSTIGQILLRSVEIEALSSEMQRHDCLAWAEEKLTAIGLPIEGCWTSFTVVLPAVVPEKAKKPASVPVVEENRFCRLM